MKLKFRFLPLLIISMLIMGCASDGKSDLKTGNLNESTSASGESEAGQEAYILEFEATTIDGEKITSECFANSKLTMINVWATYCSPCLNEMPDLGKIASAYDAADFQIIGIVCDVEYNADKSDIEYAKELIKQTKADYPHLLLNESLYSNLVAAVYAVPTTYFVTQEGEVLGYIEGARSKASWEGLINELLADME